MLDERSSSLFGIVILIVVSLFFVPNFAFADHPGFSEYVISSFILYPFSFLSIAVVYVVIKLLKSFKPSLGNYIHSNRLLKIGLYSSAWVISWVIYHIIIPAFLNKSIHFDKLFYDFLILLVIPGIILISIVIINHFVLKKVPTAIVVAVIVLMIFVFIFIIYQTQNTGIPPPTKLGVPIIESLAILGYDARDLNELKAHDQITMLKNSAGIQNNAKEKDERIVVYYKNNGIQPVTISEMRFGGLVYNFQSNEGVIDNYEGTAPSQGNYVILTDGASGLLQSSSELQPGQTVTVVLDLAHQFKVGRDAQIKITTSNGFVWVGTITIGQEENS